MFSTIHMDNPYPAATIVVGVGTITAAGMIVGAFGRPRRRAAAGGGAQRRARPADRAPQSARVRRGLRRRAATPRSLRRGGALIVVDCDGFKALNDGQGHLAGDHAPRRVAACIATNVREVDTPARLGGDEFAVLLSAPAPGTAARIGRRIQLAVHAEDDPVPTLSIGIVELPPGVSVDVTTALEAADRAMYEAKHEGGDRVALGALSPDPVAGSAQDGVPRDYAAAWAIQSRYSRQ